MHRFTDNGKYNEAFQDNISVVCPKCAEHATVTTKHPGSTKNVKIIFASCGFNQTGSDSAWHGPTVGIVRRRCKYCGRWLKKIIHGSKHAFKQKLTCPGCQCVMVENITWHKKSNLGAYDPHFGLKLWFVGNIKGQAFWAYNREHLTFIKNYVTAKIRIREPNSNRSLVSRLPSWLLSTKNRLAVKKEINKMQSAK